MVKINLAQRQNIETVGKKYVESGAQQLVKFAAGATGLYSKVKDESEEARINNSITKLNIDMAKATEEWKTKYSKDPNSAEGKAFLMDAYKNNIDKYSSGFTGKYKNLFLQNANTVMNKYSITNQSWQVAQSKQNATFQINDSIKNSLNEAYYNGMNGNIGQATVNFETYSNNLRELGNKVLGEAETDKLLQNYKSDYFKSSISGLIDQQPEKALQLLDSEIVVNGINDPKEVQQLKTMATNRFGNIAKTKAMKELADFSLKYGDVFNKAISGDLSSGELLQFANGDGASLSKNAKDALFKMAGYSKKDLEEGKQYSKEEKIQYGNDIDIAFMKVGEQEGTKKQLKSGATVEELVDFQNKLYENYAAGKIDKSKFNYYNNLILLPLQEKISKLSGKNRFFADQQIDASLSSINEATTAMANFLGSGESETLTALDVLSAGATTTSKEAAALASKLKRENPEALYTEENRQAINMMFLNKLNNRIRQETGNTMNIVDLNDMTAEQKNRYLTETAFETRKEFLISKYPQLAQQANLPEAVYMRNKGLMYSMLNPDANRTAKASVNSTRKVQRNTKTGKIYLVDVDPNTNKKRIVKELSAMEASAYYGK